MSGADDFVWRGWTLVASMFDPLGRTFRLPSLRETRRHACLLADGLGDAAKGPASESSPVSVMSQPQKLPATSAAAPINGVVVLHYKELCADPVWLPHKQRSNSTDALVMDPEGIVLFREAPPDPMTSAPSIAEFAVF